MSTLFRIADGDFSAEAVTLRPVGTASPSPTGSSVEYDNYVVQPDGDVDPDSLFYNAWIWDSARNVGCRALDDMSVNGVRMKAEGSELTVSSTRFRTAPAPLPLKIWTASRSAVFFPIRIRDRSRRPYSAPMARGSPSWQRTRLAPAHSICMSWVLMAERPPRLRERALSTRRRYCWSGGSDSRRRSVAGRAAGWRPAACCDGTAPPSGRE